MLVRAWGCQAGGWEFEAHLWHRLSLSGELSGLPAIVWAGQAAENKTFELSADFGQPKNSAAQKFRGTPLNYSFLFFIFFMFQKFVQINKKDQQILVRF